MSTPQLISSSSQIRKRGLNFLAVGTGLFILIVLLLLWLNSHAHSALFLVVGASLPLALALIGSVELLLEHRFNVLLIAGWVFVVGSEVFLAL